MPSTRTYRQKVFVREYLVDLNATQAYIRAGYGVTSPESAGTAGPRLLQNVAVRAAVDRELARRAGRAQVRADRVLRELAALAFFNAGDLFNADWTLKAPSEWDEDTARAVASFE